MKKLLLKLYNDEKGQGTVEYILLLVVIVGLAFVFKDQIMGIIKGKTEQLGERVGSFDF